MVQRHLIQVRNINIRKSNGRARKRSKIALRFEIRYELSDWSNSPKFSSQFCLKEKDYTKPGKILNKTQRSKIVFSSVSEYQMKGLKIHYEN